MQVIARGAFVLGTALVLLFPETAFAQAIFGQTDFNISVFDRQITAWGEGSYYDANGERKAVGISGTLAVYQEPSQLLTSNWDIEYDGDLSIQVQVGGDYAQCYGSSVTFQTPDKHADFFSSWKCTGPVPPPPPPPGTDIADDGSGSNCETDPTCNETTPIILALADNNYELTSLDQGVSFDLRNEGIAGQVAWTRSDIELAFLAMDRNGNGRIDNGSELFGNHTSLRSGGLAPHGFAVISELDGNADGVLDGQDPFWRQLLLWTDRNHDGLSTADELEFVSQSKVTSLDTSFRIVGRRDRWGNLFRYASTFRVMEHGRIHPRAYYDVVLLSEP